MSWMQDASIKTKVMTAFAAALFCSILMGGYALKEMSAIDSAASDVRDNWLPSVGLIGTLDAAVTRYRTLEGAHMVSTGEAEMAAEERSMKNILVKIGELRTEYGKLITPGYETEIYANFTRHWEKYLDISNNKLLKLSRANQTEAVAALFRGESRTEFSAAKTELEKLVTFNVDS